ncbi:MAG: hypothetical protein IPP88_22595 [Betaproteobacteria bacterium]|nr:hypothetical protein [Betaproteobacteria bacterium]
MAGKLLVFLDGDAAKKAMREESIVIRVFHPRGTYIRDRIQSDESLYWAGDELVFIATRTVLFPELVDDQPYSEMNWLAPEELRFLSSILLCELEEEPRTAFYPVPFYSRILSTKQLSFTSNADARKNS